MKKEERNEDPQYMKPKNENYDEFRCVTCNQVFVAEVELQKHKLSHISSNGVEKTGKSMNGDIETTDSQIFADNDSLDKRQQNLSDEDAGLKAEELSEEKIIADDDLLMNVGNSGSDFQFDADDQFPFSIDDPLPDQFIDDDSNDNAIAGEGDGEGEGEIEDEDDDDVDDGDSNHVNNDSTSTVLGGESNTSENASESDRASENEQEGECEGEGEGEGEDESQEATAAPPAQFSQETGVPGAEGAEELLATDVQSEINDQIEAESVDQAASSSSDAAAKDDGDEDDEDEDEGGGIEEHEKENEKDDDLESVEARRPSSRESVTSTASSSSERTLIVRSAFQVNKTVTDLANVVVKTEKVVPDRPAVPSISIKNPDQLGATSSTAGENLLNNANYGQPSNQVMGYMQSGLQDSSTVVQCDVCETTFADSLILEDHRASVGHYKCPCSPACADYVYSTIAELSAHQQSVHGVIPQSPVQQLQHQVQNLRYQMEQPVGNSYQTLPPYQTAASPQSRNVPPVYPNSQSNPQMRQYAPRIQPNSVRGSVPMANQVAMKRAQMVQSQRGIPPPKRRCLDNNYPIRNGDADCRVVSIQKPDNCDDVVAQLSKSITITARQENQKMNETAAVANMLANRGITVSSVPSKPNRSSNPAVAMLNLNSAVSLIPTNNNKNSNFAVPQGRVSTSRPAVSPVSGRLQTVDLTGPEPPRNKLANRTNRFTCQICDRTFFNQDQLNQHLITHRSSPRKQLPFRCNLCSAQYPNQQSLMQHRLTCRRENTVSSTNEMVIPIVDLKQPGALQRLQQIGINYMIPLNALGSQSTNGTFGIPILPFSSDRNTINNMTNCGISNILPVGPLKALGR